MEIYLFIENNKLRLSPSNKLIKARSYASISDVEDVLKKANEIADEILSKARKESEIIKEEARKVYLVEKERGYYEGKQEIQKEMAKDISAVTINAEKYLHEIEEKIITLVLDTVRKILDGIDQSELISAIIKKSLTVMRNQKHIKLKISPMHVDFLNDRITEILGSFPNIQGIQILADERLSQNQLIFESPIGIVDAGIETQLSAIKDAFTRCFSS